MRTLAIIALFGLFVAGCADPQEGKDDDFEDAFEDTPEAASGKGLIRGVVVDPAITPIADALVVLTGQSMEVTTGENGAFVFNDLDPGTYFVIVSKPGWTTIQQSVDVVANVDDPEVIRVAIEIIPGLQPRAVTQAFEGYIACSIGTYLTFHDCSEVTMEEQRADHFMDFEGVPSGVQTELVWDSTQASGEWLYVINAVCECDGSIPPEAEDPRRFQEIDDATSPYIVRFDPEWLLEHEAGTGNGQVGVDVSASGPEPQTTNGSGVALNQAFDLYITIFYNVQPDPEWTFIEDGPYKAAGV